MDYLSKERVIPVLFLMNHVLFPGERVKITLKHETSTELIDAIHANGERLGVITNISPGDGIQWGKVGTLAAVKISKPDKNGNVSFFIGGLERFKIKDVAPGQFCSMAVIEAIDEEKNQVFDSETRVLKRSICDFIRQSVELSQDQAMMRVYKKIKNKRKPLPFVSEVMINSSLDVEERQEILEILDVKTQLGRILELLYEQQQAFELNMHVAEKVQQAMTAENAEREKRKILRQTRDFINRQLGEGEETGGSDVACLKKKLDEAGLPEEVKKEVAKELGRLSNMNPQSSEYSVTISYLELIASLPWSKSTKDNLDIDYAEEVLAEDHFGLEKVKDIILQYLAVRKLNPDSRGLILCFVGPPGVGKTSLVKSIARAMGREYLRIALGGVRDEAEIRGHRRTYVGALPGKIINAIRKAGTNNPVFVLDEVDKLGADFKGDPSSALLEVLDPEQNNTFCDHYLDVPFDLSKVLFITTANNPNTIPRPLLDRMEVVRIAGYTAEEKLAIAMKYLVDRRVKDNGLKNTDVTFLPEALRKIIDRYTHEAGVRNLEQKIGTICRRLARRFASGDTSPVVVKQNDVKEYLGVEDCSPQLKEEKLKPGVVTCLFWTPLDGSIGFTETSTYRGKGIVLTGQLGSVIKESAQLAITYIKVNAKQLGVDEDYFKDKGVHIHFPEGATPKDGPSAGVAILTALVSLAKGVSVSNELAMTGEITLRGRVTAIGGLKEKVLAAQRAGIKTIIAPKDNEKNLEEIPESTRRELTFHFVENMEDVLKIALGVGNE